MFESGDVFEGVRVVELAEFIFVPAGGAVLSNFGADVIKVEHLGGDRFRQVHKPTRLANGDVVQFPFEHANRGKRSIALDIKSPEGLEILFRLIEQADVFLTNLRLDVLQRAGLDADAVRARNPQIIYARGSGFGPKGPAAGRPGYDGSAFWARGGVGQTLTPPEAAHPVHQRPALGDNQGGMNVAFGVAAALFRRERTGEGSIVDSSLLSTAAWILALDLMSGFNPDHVPAGGSRNPVWQPLHEMYRTKDNRWLAFVLLEPDRFWEPLCRHLDRLDLVDDPRFRDSTLRAANADECVRELQDTFATRTYREWREILASFDAPWEPMQLASELPDDEQVAANDYVPFANDTRRYRLVAPPVQFDERSVSPRRAPNPGEHTDEVLLELGFSPNDLIRLRDARVVA